MNDKEQRDIPENFDTKEYESLLQEIGSSQRLDFYSQAVKEGEKALLESKQRVESMGIELDGTKSMGFLYQFSAENARFLWEKVKGKHESVIVGNIASMMMRYYYLLWKSIERKENLFVKPGKPS